MFIKYSISLYRKNEMEKGDNTIINSFTGGGGGGDVKKITNISV